MSNKPETDEVKTIITKSMVTKRSIIRNEKPINICEYCSFSFTNPEQDPCNKKIEKPGSGFWVCTREMEHEGPCVACVPTEEYGTGCHLLAIKSDKEKVFIIDPCL